ncbi:hypothetical protein CFO_g1124 [Ceratocystis platani]|uniref:Zn(2)-C6 fungal-type domain-containing protein n=1 Tax=Ceratocystis fimbriata f. sp. platani TaxID=88771 RepID=A0A0F8B6Q5_CERFI|nr:hypothetical protein CFO_g1124 [Ceratocystis platani]
MLFSSQPPTSCVFCKDKKKKCDEVRPQCARCLEKGQDCIYEPIKPRQRRRRDEITNTADPVSSSSPPESAPAPPVAPSKRRKSVSLSAHHRRSSTAVERPALARPGAVPQAPAPAPATPTTISTTTPASAPASTPTLNPPHSPPKWSPETALASRMPQRVEIALDTEFDDNDIEQIDTENADVPLISPNNDIFSAAMMSFAQLDSVAFPGFESLGFDFDLPMIDSPDDATLDTSSTGSSSSADDMLVGASLGSNMEQDLVLLPAQSHTQAHGHFPQNTEREQRGSVSSTRSIVSEPSYPAQCYDSQLQNYHQQPQISFEFNLPSFFEFSDLRNRRALIDHFCNVLSHLLVFKEDSGNPFQQLVLPLCHSSIVVTNAVYALASAHLEHRGVEFSETSDFFHRQVITGLAKLIAQGGKANRNELLASIMLLIYYEVLVQKGRSSIVDDHLRGALTVMTTRYQSPAFPDATDQFLERAFKFYDVISALSLGRAPLSHSYLDTTPSFLNSTPSSSNSSIDSLLGMFTSLWPIIHRLSALQGLKRNLAAAITAENASSIPILKAEFETGSAAIETALEEWQPELPGGCSIADLSPDSNPSTSTAVATDSATALHPAQGRVRSILNNALAYRHSASVFLYRSIYGCARDHPLVQRHAHAALVHCMRTVQNAGPMSALLWPLFVAACEASETADRDLARRAFLAVDRRQGMVNIQHAWTIVQEVWKRADVMAEKGTAEDLQPKEDFVLDVPKNRFEEDLWRTVSDDLGIKVVFG